MVRFWVWFSCVWFRPSSLRLLLPPPLVFRVASLPLLFALASPSSARRSARAPPRFCARLRGLSRRRAAAAGGLGRRASLRVSSAGCGRSRRCRRCFLPVLRRPPAVPSVLPPLCCGWPAGCGARPSPPCPSLASLARLCALLLGGVLSRRASALCAAAARAFSLGCVRPPFPPSSLRFAAGGRGAAACGRGRWVLGARCGALWGFRPLLPLPPPPPPGAAGVLDVNADSVTGK